MHTHVFPLSDPDGQLFCFVLVIYKFEGVPEHVVLVKPHGNAKRSGQYTRTKESTKQKLKDQLKTAAPKLAVDQVYESKGGILKATSGGDLPRGLQQAYDLKRANREELSVCPVYSSCGTRDMLFTVMQQCKTAEKGTVFVRDVTCAPEPMAVIATDQQLLDLERFCTNPYDFCVLGIDPTFKLGDFSVTPNGVSASDCGRCTFSCIPHYAWPNACTSAQVVQKLQLLLINIGGDKANSCPCTGCWN